MAVLQAARAEEGTKKTSLKRVRVGGRGGIVGWSSRLEGYYVGGLFGW